MKDWKTFLRENGYSVFQVFDDVRRENLIEDALYHVKLYCPDYYVKSLTKGDCEKIAEDFESRYCEHEIASNIWWDVINDWAKEHGWKI